MEHPQFETTTCVSLSCVIFHRFLLKHVRREFDHRLKIQFFLGKAHFSRSSGKTTSTKRPQLRSVPRIASLAISTEFSFLQNKTGSCWSKTYKLSLEIQYGDSHMCTFVYGDWFIFTDIHWNPQLWFHDSVISILVKFSTFLKK